MQRTPTIQERGSAFVLALVLSFMLVGAVGLLYSAASSQSRSSIAGEAHEQMLLQAENGFAKSKVLLINDPAAFQLDVAGIDTPPYAIGDATADGKLRIAEDDAQVWVLSLGDTSAAGASGPWVYQVTSIGTVGGSSRTIRTVIEVDKQADTAAGAGLGAVVAQGNVDLSGNIDVDGNDHDRTGALVASGVGDRPGVVTTGNVVVGGSSAVGGNGNQLSGSATSPSHYLKYTTTWASEADPTNGTDDDGDGIIDDQFFGEFPGTRTAVNTLLGAPSSTNPQRGAGAFLDWPTGLPESALRTVALASGTLFESATPTAAYAAYSAWLSATPPEDQGGKIIYIRIFDEDDGGPATDHTNGVQVSGSSTFELPVNPALDATDVTRMPSLLIVGRAPSSVDGIIEHDLRIKNLHGGPFQGLLIMDQLDKVNSGTLIVGAVVAFDAGNTHLFGNGNSDILFSNDVLDRLPSGDPNAGRIVNHVLAWWED